MGRGTATSVVPAKFSSHCCDGAISAPSSYDDLLGYRDALLGIVSRPETRVTIPVFGADRTPFADGIEPFLE